MAWYAYKYGEITVLSEQQANATEIYNILYGYGYSLEAICAILANIKAESGYNPWQWEGDDVRTTSNYLSFSGGYGLVQWTPCWEYIDNSIAQGYSGYSPNFDNQQGTENDGNAQILFVNYQLFNGGNWIIQAPGSDQYNAYLNRLSEIGIDYTRFYNVTAGQFKAASGPNPGTVYTRDDWIGAFATNYLRPNSYALRDRWTKMTTAYDYWWEYFSGQPPTPPTPTARKGMPVWMMIDYRF